MCVLCERGRGGCHGPPCFRAAPSVCGPPCPCLGQRRRTEAPSADGLLLMMVMVMMLPCWVRAEMKFGATAFDAEASGAREIESVRSEHAQRESELKRPVSHLR